ncbi:MAG: S9 family peptidase [Armatimonadetes bacterium]|nr:S9 family peptidase [Armatimonadota bacterium]
MWVEAQNAVTNAYLSGVERRGAIHARLTALTDYERVGLPEKAGTRYLYTRNTGLQNQSVLYVANEVCDSVSDTLDGDGRVLLDPNTLSPDGTVALSGTAVSANGEYLAYALAESGSDWNTWRIRDVSTGADLPDEIKWSKFGGAAWAKDGSGFYYSRYDEPAPGEELSGTNYYQKLFFHQIGTAQTADTLVYERPDHKDWGFYAQVSDDGAFLLITATQGTDEKNRLFYKRLGVPGAEVLPLFPDLDASYDFVGNDGDTFYIRTNNAAPMYRLVAVDLANLAPAAWREIVPESESDTLRNVSLFGDTFIVAYLRDARTVLQTFDITGTALGEIALPGIGSAGGFGGKRNDTETFYAFTGFTTPSVSYRYDLTTGQSSVFRSPSVAFDPADYETRQVFYPSPDGTRVPMFVTHKKGIALDGSNPTYLYGYGGFNISLTPFFSVNALTWMEMGGVYAVANLRGGGEYGESWHEAGMKTRKQNVFDDFIAAGEYLVREGYTSPAKLAIAGGSNGGLLVGACMNQRPDLFAAALPAVGVMDMIRFPKFTIGWAWQADYGSPDNADEFAALFAYSPLHNLKKGTSYPATLVLTSDHDDRVVPAHSYKYAARLQEVQAGDAPVLIRIETKAGHGAGKPITKQIDQTADMYAFLVRVLEM